MEYLVLKRVTLTLILVFVYGKAQFLNAVEPEDILAPAIGPVVILPKVSLSIAYDDNVFISGDDSKKLDDYITTFSPSVGLRYGQNILDSNYLGINYSTSIQSYAENSELNTDNHLLGFVINYEKEGKFNFSGNDQVSLDNTLLRGGQSSLFTALGDDQKGTRGLLVERLSSIDNYRFEYIISPKTSIYAETELNMIDYEEEPHYYYKNVFGESIAYSLFDVSTWSNSVGFGWAAFSKIKLYGSFFYGDTSVDTNLKSMGLRPDSYIYGSRISAVGVFNDKLTGQVQLGYQTREFDRFSDGIAGNSHGTPIFNVRLNYQYTEKGEVAFRYNRQGTVSVEDPNIAVESDLISMLINQKIGSTGRYKATVDLSYNILSYENRGDLQYNNFLVNTGLVYSFNQWMSANLTYGLEIFQSNQDNVDYTSNRVMLGLSVGY